LESWTLSEKLDTEFGLPAASLVCGQSRVAGLHQDDRREAAKKVDDGSGCRSCCGSGPWCLGAAWFAADAVLPG
jgi:hypothetical protein